MLRVLHGLAGRVDPSVHPLLADRDVNAPGARMLLIVVSADKGLAGSFNSNVIKVAAHLHRSSGPGQQIELMLVGRKARDFFRRRGVRDARRARRHLLAPRVGKHARAIARPAIEDFVRARSTPSSSSTTSSSRS